ncbi:MAG: hypothetical protein CL840_11945 [Crocinitomicaceae bacterium]|nr:hypothetical protein [Crocinitomicaceae bacterium]|tara:strand:- start:11108 stop:11953 length:846 start_codon:yes stop_codon:yes gene_type:complete
MKFCGVVVVSILIFGCGEPVQLNKFYKTNLPEGFHRNWYKLTETDSGYIAYKPCDAANKSINLTEGSVTIDYGQEEVVFEVLNIDSNRRGFYRFILETDHSLDTIVFCSVDDESGIATWKESFSSFDFDNDELYISDKNYFNFKEVIEPCATCYAEECLEKDKRLFDRNLPFQILNLETNTNYPSSAEDDSMCEGWWLDEEYTKLVFRNSRYISGSEWHALYDHLPCQVKGELQQLETKFTFSINGGSWLSIGNKDTSAIMGYFGVSGLFISEAWSEEDGD